MIAFHEVQHLLRVERADGILRSVIQPAQAHVIWVRAVGAPPVLPPVPPERNR